MNFTESFDQFSSRVSSMDLALYAGIGLIIWVLFKEKLSPVQTLILSLFDGLKSKVNPVVSPSVSVTETKIVNVSDDDTFFKLVSSWKQTRDLAEQSNCLEAVKAADQMFPLLGPNVCGQSKPVVIKQANI